MLTDVVNWKIKKLLKSYKTEINPTLEQRQQINKTIGVCRYVYNFYLAHSKKLYESGQKFMTGKDFSKWLNNNYLPNNPDKLWIKEVSSKSVKRSLSKMYNNLKKGKTQKKNIFKQKLKVQKLHQRLANIRTDYINKVVSETVKTKPLYITIEDLNIKGMMKNKHLSKAIAEQKFYEFREKLIAKCHQNNIEMRIADRFYPSSKRCHCCGKINKGLKLSDRTFHCECGYSADRDFNASLNLRDTETYSIA